MSIPWLRAASRTRNGNFPLPAIRPYLLDDSTIRRLDEIQNDFDFRSHKLPADGGHGLAGVQPRSQKETKRGADVSDLFGRKALALETDRIDAVSMRVALADRFRIRQ